MTEVFDHQSLWFFEKGCLLKVKYEMNQKVEKMFGPCLEDSRIKGYFRQCQDSDFYLGFFFFK